MYKLWTLVPFSVYAQETHVDTQDCSLILCFTTDFFPVWWLFYVFILKLLYVSWWSSSTLGKAETIWQELLITPLTDWPTHPHCLFRLCLHFCYDGRTILAAGRGHPSVYFPGSQPSFTEGSCTHSTGLYTKQLESPPKLLSILLITHPLTNQPTLQPTYPLVATYFFHSLPKQNSDRVIYISCYHFFSNFSSN